MTLDLGRKLRGWQSMRITRWLLDRITAQRGEAPHVLYREAREDMATLYTPSAVLLFPSHCEGFGLPVLEAQMCGTPVVCSDKGALPEVDFEALKQHVPSESAPEYCKAIMKSLNSFEDFKRKREVSIAPGLITDWQLQQIENYGIHRRCSGRRFS